jgi:hypothetical protein
MLISSICLYVLCMYVIQIQGYKIKYSYRSIDVNIIYLIECVQNIVDITSFDKSIVLVKNKE